MGKSMFWRYLLFLAGAALAMAAGADPGAAAAGPQAVIRGTIETLRAAVVRDKALIEHDPDHAVELVDRIVSPHVDTARSGRLILGRHWRDATPAQQQEFIDEFKRLLLRTYAINVTDYTDVNIEYLRTDQDSGDPPRAVVRTRIALPGKNPANVDYRMIQTAEGWKVYDVLANGVSIVATFRTGVDAEIREHGIDGLIARLGEKARKPMHDNPQ